MGPEGPSGPRDTHPLPVSLAHDFPGLSHLQISSLCPEGPCTRLPSQLSAPCPVLLCLPPWTAGPSRKSVCVLLIFATRSSLVLGTQQVLNT